MCRLNMQVKSAVFSECKGLFNTFYRQTIYNVLNFVSSSTRLWIFYCVLYYNNCARSISVSYTLAFSYVLATLYKLYTLRMFKCKVTQANKVKYSICSLRLPSENPELTLFKAKFLRINNVVSYNQLYTLVDSTQ